MLQIKRGQNKAKNVSRIIWMVFHDITETWRFFNEKNQDCSKYAAVHILFWSPKGLAV